MAFEQSRGQDRFGKALRYTLLFLSAMLIVTGLVGRGRGNGEMAIDVMDTPAPTHGLSAYDETPDTREIVIPQTIWYAVQLGVFENEQSANEQAKDYQARGAAGYVYKDSRYRVLAALYESKEDVSFVREQLRVSHSLDTYAFDITMPELTLRLSGAKGQLDALETGYHVLSDLVTQLARKALLIDRQELNRSELLEAFAQTRSDLAALSEQIILRFQTPRHKAVDGLIAAYAQFEDFAQSLEKTGDVSLVRLAAITKHQAFTLLDALRGVYESFQT